MQNRILFEQYREDAETIRFYLQGQGRRIKYIAENTPSLSRCAGNNFITFISTYINHQK
jgi:hypothetical protein